MSKGLVESSSLVDIAAAIRAKGGTSATLKASEMAAAIQTLPAGEAVLEPVTITENGTTTPPTGVDGFSSVTTNVPNSFSASDEGKVVSSGELVAQTSRTVTANGTIDTTLNNEVVVNVAGGSEGSGGANVITGTSAPSQSQGSVGDVYVQYAINEPPTEPRDQTYTLVIESALRGSSALTYAGAQEIQLFFDDGQGNETNIRDFSNFSASAKTGQNATSDPGYAFDGNTGGNYWETNPTPITVTFSATIPAGYSPSKLVVWQRTGSYSSDVWRDFRLDEAYDGTSRNLISITGLAVSDWAGAGNGTEFLTNNESISVVDTYLKVGTEGQSTKWVKHDFEVIIDTTASAGTLPKVISEGLVPQLQYIEHDNYFVGSDGSEGYTVGGSNIFTTVAYELDVNSSYVLTLGAQYGTRFRAGMVTARPFTTVPSSGSGDVTIQSGTSVISSNSPTAYQCVSFKATAPYLIVYLSNTNQHIDCYLYKIV